MTRTAVVSITATRLPSESVTASRRPGLGSASPSIEYSAASAVVVVLAPSRIAPTSRSRSGPGKANSATGRSSGSTTASPMALGPEAAAHLSR